MPKEAPAAETRPASPPPDEVESLPAGERQRHGEIPEPAPTAGETVLKGETATQAEDEKEARQDEEDLKSTQAPAVPADDEEIAARIAAFEKELALVCPLCKTSALKEQTTSAGKIFYTCTSGQCNFISWGRPHQIPCPRCKNSFMVEVSDADGQVFLKCPRATCQHRQPLVAAPAAPATVRKVVRKRLVRRKA